MSATHGFKFEAPDGKLRETDVLCGVLKKVDSGSGKLGYVVYSLVRYSQRALTEGKDSPLFGIHLGVELR